MHGRLNVKLVVVCCIIPLMLSCPFRRSPYITEHMANQ